MPIKNIFKTIEAAKAPAANYLKSAKPLTTAGKTLVGGYAIGEGADLYSQMSTGEKLDPATKLMIGAAGGGGVSGFLGKGVSSLARPLAINSLVATNLQAQQQRNFGVSVTDPKSMRADIINNLKQEAGKYLSEAADVDVNNEALGEIWGPLQARIKAIQERNPGSEPTPVQAQPSISPWLQQLAERNAAYRSFYNNAQR